MAGSLSTLLALQQILLNCAFGFYPPLRLRSIWQSLTHTLALRMHSTIIHSHICDVSIPYHKPQKSFYSHLWGLLEPKKQFTALQRNIFSVLKC